MAVGNFYADAVIVACPPEWSDVQASHALPRPTLRMRLGRRRPRAILRRAHAWTAFSLAHPCGNASLAAHGRMRSSTAASVRLSDRRCMHLRPWRHQTFRTLFFMVCNLVCSAGVPGGGKPQRQRLWRDGRGCGSNWLVRSGLHTSGDRRAQTPVQERRQLGGRHHQRVPTYGADWPCSRSWFAIADAISERCPLCG